MLRTLLEQLHATGILTEDLAVPNDFSDLELVYRGLCKLPAPGAKRRRIDVLCVPWVNRGAALLYYTVSISPISRSLICFISHTQGDDIVSALVCFVSERSTGLRDLVQSCDEVQSEQARVFAQPTWSICRGLA